MMHYGHSNALRQARALGDELVVGLVSDDEIVKNKGSAPVMPFEERLAALAACKFVDEVIAGVAYELTEDWVKVLLKDHAVDYIAHGDDPCVTADGKDAYEYPKRIDRFRMFKRTEGVSTTDLVGRMLLMSRDHHIRPGDKRNMHSLRSSSLHDADPGTGHVVDAAAQADAEGGSASSGTSWPEVVGGTPPQRLYKSRAAMAKAQAAEPSPSDEASKSSSKSSSSSKGQEPAEHPVPEKRGEESSGDAHGSSSAAPSSSASTATTTTSGGSVGGVSEAGSDWRFMPTSRRIAQFAEGRTPAEADRVVYISGSWDLFNAGHAAALREAREHGDFVLVGVYDDETVHKLHGCTGGAPVMNLFERALSVLACRFVDDVVMGAPLAVTQDLLKTFKVDMVLDGSVSESKASDPSVVEAALSVPRRLGLLHTFRSPSPLVASDVIDRVLAKKAMFEARVRRKQASEIEYREQRVFLEEQ